MWSGRVPTGVSSGKVRMGTRKSFPPRRTTCVPGHSPSLRRTRRFSSSAPIPAPYSDPTIAGATWRELPIQLVEECLIGPPRITRIRFDPIDDDTIWASAEIDAVHRSRDGGETWERLEDGFDFPDIHDIAIIDDKGARKCLAATARGLYKSTDEGASWHFQALDSPWQYTRGMKPRADLDGTLFLCNGDGPPGSQGTLWRSRDWGETWEDAHLPPTNSTPWMVGDERR